MNSIAADAARLFEIAGVNALLSGDNAVAVGMTVRNLPGTQRAVASAGGVAIAALAQIAATLTVAELLNLPLAGIAGGLLLCVIAVRLLHENGRTEQLAFRFTHRGPLRSMLTVTGSYLIMSLDNIIAVAAVGRGHPWLLIFGLALSSMVIIAASLAIANLMRRYPIVLTTGAGMVGWVGGSMLASAGSRLTHVFSGRIIGFIVPAAMSIIVLTSPIWWPSRNANAPAD